jgi:hypothetical protein
LRLNLTFVTSALFPLELVTKINQESDEYMAGINGLTPDEKCRRFDNVHHLFEKAKEYSDDKVQLAMQTYEMVDKHIRRLDAELAKLEADIKEKQTGGVVPDEGKKKSGGRGREKKHLTVRSVASEESEQRKEAELSLMALVPAAGNELLDMPVDPNEPTYCVCHQVSYGEMIGCDNPECPIEWFHFGCVGLSAKPKGKWYCAKCTTDRKKK